MRLLFLFLFLRSAIYLILKTIVCAEIFCESNVLSVRSVVFKL
jgi:hypothetical protein